jgi:hypothetical protein
VTGYDAPQQVKVRVYKLPSTKLPQPVQSQWGVSIPDTGKSHVGSWVDTGHGNFPSPPFEIRLDIAAHR